MRRTADRLEEALLGERIDAIDLRTRDGLDPAFERRLAGGRVLGVPTYGKHLVIAFEGDLWLHNHMMMWGKWRTYPREKYDAGEARPPRRFGKPGPRTGPTVQDVREDSRVRLVLTTAGMVAVEFNGPLLRFTDTDPATEGAIARLGPDALRPRFARRTALRRLAERDGLPLADVLLDQTFVAGIGNKYKSELLFLLGLHPFLRVGDLDERRRETLVGAIPKLLKHGYRHAGLTRPEKGEAASRWDRLHWVFRRGGKPCLVCTAPIATDRASSARVTFHCPVCQPAEGPGRRSLAPLAPAA